MPQTATPPWMVKDGPTEEDFLRRRADARVRDLQQAKAEQEAEAEQIALIMAVKDDVDADPDFAWNMVTKRPDGTLDIVKHVVSKAPPELAGLLQERPFLSTSLMWQNTALEDRLELARSYALNPGVALSEDILEVLPDATRVHLSAWQGLINTGIVWNVSGTVGRRANSLIEAGFCLGPRTRTIGTFQDYPGRRDLVPGTPGSPAFMQALMGVAYLAWMDDIP